MTVRLYDASVKSDERVERAEIVRSRLVEFRNHSRVERRPLVVSYFREGAVALERNEEDRGHTNYQIHSENQEHHVNQS